MNAGLSPGPRSGSLQYAGAIAWRRRSGPWGFLGDRDPFLRRPAPDLLCRCARPTKRSSTRRRLMTATRTTNSHGWDAAGGRRRLAGLSGLPSSSSTASKRIRTCWPCSPLSRTGALFCAARGRDWQRELPAYLLRTCPRPPREMISLELGHTLPLRHSLVRSPCRGAPAAYPCPKAALSKSTSAGRELPAP